MSQRTQRIERLMTVMLFQQGRYPSLHVDAFELRQAYDTASMIVDFIEQTRMSEKEFQDQLLFAIEAWGHALHDYWEPDTLRP